MYENARGDINGAFHVWHRVIAWRCLALWVTDTVAVPFPAHVICDRVRVFICICVFLIPLGGQGSRFSYYFPYWLSNLLLFPILQLSKIT